MTNKGLADASGQDLFLDSKTNDGEASPHYLGHRQRLRERFLNGGAENLPDYELLELLLFSAIPRKDTKPIAKNLLKRFGSFAEVISADPEKLRQVDDIKDVAIVTLKAVQAAAQRLLRSKVTTGLVITSWSALIEYCTAQMAYNATEQFRVLYLDKKNKVIADEEQQKGTVDHTPVYPREVVKRALELNASSFIMVHNHPSGDPKPSQTDIDMTRRVKDAATAVGLTLHDHVIVSRGGSVSFKTLG
ncbi:MAG: JAB domain-containing protein, partial [Rhodospirillaceae bacterium]|nr:JAB domain-containing protein [Rhodospirillaceae bacterium]